MSLEEEDNSMDVEVTAAASGDEDSSMDDDSDSENVDFDGFVKKAAELENQIVQNVHIYQNHIELINIYSKLGELEQLRTARKRMHETFPLSAELWSKWCQDEIKLVSVEEDKLGVIELFEKAVQDYLFVDIWQEYTLFAIGCQELKDKDWVRSVLERAVNHCGIHASKGAMLWDTYREYEKFLLSMLKDSAATEEQILEQQKRIANLFKRQLACPLLDMELTYQEFQKWLTEDGNDNTSNRIIDVKIVEYGYKMALQTLSKILTLEEHLICSQPDSRLSLYETYLKHEKDSGNNPTRVQCLYERAIEDLPLTDSLWISYIEYMTTTIQIEEPVFKVIEKATRNIPWVSDIWVFYIQEMERYEKPLLAISGILERAMSVGFSTDGGYHYVWMTYVEYLRRSYDALKEAKKVDEAETIKEKLIAVLQRFYAHIVGLYGIGGDPNYKILQYWAYFEASRCKNLEKMRLIWNDIIRDYGSDRSEIWLRYIAMERLFGDEKHLRKLYQRALNAKTDVPESIAHDWLLYEQCEGSLDTCVAAKMKIEERLKIAELEREERKKKNKVKENNNKKDNTKRKTKGNDSLQTNKQPKFANAVVTTVIRKPGSGGHNKSEPMDVGQSKPSMEQTEEERLKEKGAVAEHDSSKDHRTVFVSNLEFTVDEGPLREVLKSAGTIEEVRLVKNYKGLSKGFAYVVFSTQKEAEAALKMDRNKLNSRPMYISECNTDKTSRKVGLRFSVGVLEKNKLFIKGLPFTTTEEDLKKLFGQYGDVTDVRLVVYKNGHSKGLAYVEYKDEASAAQAILKTDKTMIGDKEISVALSKPPERKAGMTSSEFAKPFSLGGGTVPSSAGRGKGRTQLSLVPRSVKISTATTPAPASTKTSVNNNDEKTSNVKSNQDFRNMLLGNK